MGATDRPLDRTVFIAVSSKSQELFSRLLERCFMNADPKDTDIDDTPEYPLPSPTDSLSRDQRPPDDEAGVEQVPDDAVKRGDVETEPEDVSGSRG